MTSRRGCVLAWRRRHQDGRAARRAAPAAASAGREAAPAAARGVQRGTRQPPPPQPALASQGQAAPPAAPPAGAAPAVPGEPASSSSCSSGSLSGSASEPASACSAAWPLSGSPSSLLPPCRAAGPCLSGRGGRRAQRTGLGRGAAHHGAGGAIGRHEVRLGDVKEAAAVLGRRARLARLGARPWRAPAHTQRRRWLKDPVHGFSPCARGGPRACRPLPGARSSLTRGRRRLGGRTGGAGRQAAPGGGACRAGTRWTWRAGQNRRGGRRRRACAGWPPAPPCWTRWRRSRPRTRTPPRPPSCCPRPAAPRPAAARCGVGRRGARVRVTHPLPLRRLWSRDAGMVAPLRRASGRPGRCMQRPVPAQASSPSTHGAPAARRPRCIAAALSELTAEDRGRGKRRRRAGGPHARQAA